MLPSQVGTMFRLVRCMPLLTELISVRDGFHSQQAELKKGAIKLLPNRRGRGKTSSMATLYCGDNLDILRRYLEDETVELVYLDPPINSAQNYNAFFHEQAGADAASRIRAFQDTCSWNQESQGAHGERIESWRICRGYV